MIIGSLGGTAFEVSPSRIRTFSGLQRTGSARYAEHVPIASKPVQEFLGPGSNTVSFSMTLHARLGVVPMEEIARLRGYMLTGEVVPLFIGEEMLGDYVIETLGESYNEIDGQGRVIVVEINVSLKEAGV